MHASEFGHDAFFGWELQQNEQTSTLADSRSLWSASEGARLTPETKNLPIDAIRRMRAGAAGVWPGQWSARHLTIDDPRSKKN